MTIEAITFAHWRGIASGESESKFSDTIASYLLVALQIKIIHQLSSCQPLITINCTILTSLGKLQGASFVHAKKFTNSIALKLVTLL